MTEHSRRTRKATGSHYTPPELARFLAEQLAEHWLIERPGTAPRILDPAAGDGALLAAAGFSFQARGVEPQMLAGFDTDHSAISLCRQRLEGLFPSWQLQIELRDVIETSRVGYGHSQDLFQETNDEEFDLIITNPPYVRTQVLGASRAQELAKRFELSGRVDLAHVFVRLYGAYLASGGILGAILSNRFMVTKAGAATREYFLRELPPIEIWDFGDTKLFGAAVLPAVILASKNREWRRPEVKFTSIYQAKGCGKSLDAGTVIEAAQGASPSQLEISRGVLRVDEGTNGVWRVESPSNLAWLEQINSKTALRFEDVGPIRVGVKTTADDVFIRSDWTSACAGEHPELLRPLVTHHVSQPIRAVLDSSTKKILYPHEYTEEGRRAVDLRLYPIAAAYLEQHRERLESRTYVREAGREWFEIWVPQDPRAWDQEKIVFRDISDRPTFWLGGAGSVVNGDCYWLLPRPGNENLIWLVLGVGNSSLALEYYDRRFQNRLYAGRRRFMTQYVSEFPLPDPKSEAAKAIMAEVKRLYKDGPPLIKAIDLANLDRLVERAFGLVEEISG